MDKFVRTSVTLLTLWHCATLHLGDLHSSPGQWTLEIKSVTSVDSTREQMDTAKVLEVSSIQKMEYFANC